MGLKEDLKAIVECRNWMGMHLRGDLPSVTPAQVRVCQAEIARLNRQIVNAQTKERWE